MIEPVMNDLKFSIRQFLKNPGFTVVALRLPTRRASHIEPMEALRTE